ncbi:MAG: hypothetical protein KIT14_03100 [bacterium]|nr:hypothetical protein [bacterium]
MVWLVALLLYAGFLGWYQNWRGPLTPAEVERFMGQLEAKSLGTPAERSHIRAFLAADDGGEFHMLNLVRLHAEQVPNPVTGELQTGRQLLEGYTAPFVRALFRRGGHPAFLGFPIGDVVDTWGVEPPPRWSLVGMMRYRSRRDMIELVVSDRFSSVHVLKHAAMPATTSFPMSRTRFMMGPRVWVALLLLLGAALVKLALR